MGTSWIYTEWEDPAWLIGRDPHPEEEWYIFSKSNYPYVDKYNIVHFCKRGLDKKILVHRYVLLFVADLLRD